MASLHLWKKVAAPLQNRRVWKMAFSTVASPFSSDDESSTVAAPFSSDDESSGPTWTLTPTPTPTKAEKRKVFQKLKSFTVETIDLILREEEKNGVYVKNADLVNWAKRLEKKNGKPEHALAIFRWMDREKKIFSPSELALYVDLIAKVEGLCAANKFFKKVDPNFNNMDAHARNRPAYSKLLDLMEDAYQKNTRITRHPFILGSGK